VFILNNVEKSIPVALKISAKMFPFSSSTAFQTTTIVNTPKRAGKNLTQNTEFPKRYINDEIHDVTGGTEK